MRDRIDDLTRIRSVEIQTSNHTHFVIGTGAGDPQKLDPQASRETLDHSIMYIFAVALEDGSWHHESSYARERATRPSTVALWRKITTVEDPEWTRRYHASEPGEKAFGGRVVITMDDGSVIEDSLAVADAHPLGARPFGARNTSRSSRRWPRASSRTAISARFLRRRNATVRGRGAQLAGSCSLG